MRNFLMSIPDEVVEAAIVDGATPFQVLVHIVFPLSLPVIATVGLFYAVFHWNAWFDAVIYISDLNKLPIQPILRSILEIGAGQYSDRTFLAEEILQPPPAEVLKAALVVVTTAPVLLIYPFIQKYFVKGVRLGAVKG
jgi:putative aldouronate transport system permease protein